MENAVEQEFEPRTGAAEDATVYGIAILILAERDLGGGEHLAARNAADAAVFHEFSVVGGEVELCLDNQSRNRGADLKHKVIEISTADLAKERARIDEIVNNSVLGRGCLIGVFGTGAGLKDNAVRLCCKGVCRILQRKLHQLRVGLCAINVVNLEIEIFCEIDHKIGGEVGENLSGTHIRVFEIVINVDAVQSADLDGVSFFLDIAIELAGAVCNADVCFVKGLAERFAPNGGNKIRNSHNVFSFLFLF